MQQPGEAADPDGSIAIRGHRKGNNDATYDIGLVPR